MHPPTYIHLFQKIGAGGGGPLEFQRLGGCSQGGGGGIAKIGGLSLSGQKGVPLSEDKFGSKSN